MFYSSDRDLVVGAIDAARAIVDVRVPAAAREPLAGALLEARTYAGELAVDPSPPAPTTIPGALPTQPGSPAVMPTPATYSAAVRARSGSPSLATSSTSWMASARSPRWGMEYAGNNMPTSLGAFWVWVGDLGRAELAALGGTTPPAALPMADATVTLATEAQVNARRTALRQYIWGTDTLPATVPTVREVGITNPFATISNLERVDRLKFAPGYAGEIPLVWHIIPAVKINKVMFVSGGHQGTCTPASFGPATQRVIDYFVPKGWSVVVYNMPLCGADHTPMFTAVGNAAMKYFFNPINDTINYFQDAALVAADGIPTYTVFAMVGASGGGWTGVVYGALDPRVEAISTTAGWLPLDMRMTTTAGESIGDGEQSRPNFYNTSSSVGGVCGYRDLVTLASHGYGRRVLSIHNDNDTCCFGPLQYKSSQYGGLSWVQATDQIQSQISAALTTIGGGGKFDLYRDALSSGHTISPSSLPIIEALLNTWSGPPRISFHA